jgi:hypothetical protein
VAPRENSGTFGAQVAADVQRREVHQGQRQAGVGDGQADHGAVREMYLLPVGFLAILDFVHLLSYLDDAAHACRGSHAT